MASTGAVTTYRRARRRRQPAVAGCCAPPACSPGDHVAFCMENHPRYLEVAWGCHYAGAVYTAASSRLTSGELSYIVRDCEAKVFITSKAKADQAAEIVADTPGVTLRLMLDGTIDGYESYEAAVDGADRRAARPTASPAWTCSTRRARPGCPRASRGRSRPSRWRRRRTACSPCCSCCSAPTTRRVYLSPAPLYHAAPLRFCMSVHAARRHRRRDGALRRRAVPGARSSAPRHPHPGRADDVRPPAQAARRRARPATTCRRCGASSTPPRRARCRSSSR